MNDDLNQRLDQIEKDLKDRKIDPEAAEPVTKSKETKMSKVKKKVSKKSAVKSESKKANGSENLVHLSKLASEAKITTQSARKKLREAEVERTGRWSWEEGSKGLKDARKALGLS